MSVVGSEHDIDPVGTLSYTFAVFLRHAATDGDLHPRVAGLRPFQAPQIAPEAFVGVLANRAGVDDDDIGLFRNVGRRHAVGVEQTTDAFGVVLVHLATERAYEVCLPGTLRLAQWSARRHAKQGRLSHGKPSALSAGVVLGPVFANHRDLDLPRIL